MYYMVEEYITSWLQLLHHFKHKRLTEILSPLQRYGVTDVASTLTFAYQYYNT